MDVEELVVEKAKAAKKAAHLLAVTSTQIKNEALLAMADVLEKRSELVLEANEADLEDARQKGLKRSYLDRLCWMRTAFGKWRTVCGRLQPCRIQSVRETILRYVQMA